MVGQQFLSLAVLYVILLLLWSAAIFVATNVISQIVKKETTNVDFLYHSAFVVAGITLVLLEFKRTQFINWLKEKENNVWVSLNRPSGYFLSYLFKIDGFRLEKYILKKEYLDLNDCQLKQAGNQLFVIQIVFFVSIVVFFILLFAGLFTYNP